MGIFSTFTPTLINCLGEVITYTPRAGAPVQFRAVVDHGSTFERRHPGLYCSALFLEVDLVHKPAAGDSLTFDGHVCQVVKDVDRDGHGAVTVYARFLREA